MKRIFDFKFKDNPEPAYSVKASSLKQAYYLGVRTNPRFKNALRDDRMTIEPRTFSAHQNEVQCPNCRSFDVVTNSDDSSMWICRRDGWAWDKELEEKVEEAIDQLVGEQRSPQVPLRSLS